MDTIAWIVNIIALAYIALPLLAGLHWLIFRPVIKPEQLTLLADLLKWYMISVAAVFLVKMIESSYTERETGVKEAAVFDKYTNVILNTDSLEKKWALTYYFSIVTPTERLRARWITYLDSIRPSYLELREINRKKDSLALTKLSDSAKTHATQKLNDRANAIQQAFSTTTSTTAGTTPKVNDVENARLWESRAFNALLAQDMDGAIDAFNNAEQSFNGYHMAYDIWFYLRKYRKTHTSPDWKEIYRDVLDMCSRFKGSIPADAAAAMHQKLSAK